MWLVLSTLATPALCGDVEHQGAALWGDVDHPGDALVCYGKSIGWDLLWGAIDEASTSTTAGDAGLGEIWNVVKAWAPPGEKERWQRETKTLRGAAVMNKNTLALPKSDFIGYLQQSARDALMPPREAVQPPTPEQPPTVPSSPTVPPPQAPPAHRAIDSSPSGWSFLWGLACWLGTILQRRRADRPTRSRRHGAAAPPQQAHRSSPSQGGGRGVRDEGSVCVILLMCVVVWFFAAPSWCSDV